MLIGFRLALRGRLCVMNGDGMQGTIVYSRDKLLTFCYSEKELQDGSLLKIPRLSMRAVFEDVTFIRLFGAVSLERFSAAVKSPGTLKIPLLQAYTKAIALRSHVARTTNI